MSKFFFIFLCQFIFFNQFYQLKFWRNASSEFNVVKGNGNNKAQSVYWNFKRSPLKYKHCKKDAGKKIYIYTKKTCNAKKIIKKQTRIIWTKKLKFLQSGETCCLTFCPRDFGIVIRAQHMMCGKANAKISNPATDKTPSI